MRIEFDSGNATELAAISALISVLRGETLLKAQRINFVDPADEQSEPDAAEAFAGGAAAEQVFSAPPVVPAGAEPVAGPTTVPPAPAAGGATTPAATESGASATSPGGVEVDKNGIPHDTRIHSNPASKTADGAWRKKRGVDSALVETVSAELRQIMAAGNGTARPEPMFEESAPGVPLPATGAAAVTASPESASGASEVPPPPVATVPVPPVAVPAPPVAPTPVPALGGMTFTDLMRKITGMQAAQQLTVEQTAEIAKSLGLTGVRDLMHRPDLVPAFDALLPAA